MRQNNNSNNDNNSNNNYINSNNNYFNNISKNNISSKDKKRIKIKPAKKAPAESRRSIKLLRPFFFILLALTLLAGGVGIAEIRTEPFAHVDPDYPKLDLLPILNQDDYTSEDYHTLFLQTGLGRPAVDALRSEPDYVARMLQFQANFFSPVTYTCEKIVFTTSQEFLTYETADAPPAYELAPLQNGDILITKSAHTFGWRNGHAGIVVDARSGTTVEAISLGQPSCYQTVESWTDFPNLIVLRLKEDSREIGNNAAKAADQYLVDIPYRITTGILSPKYMGPGEIKGTHCSHLVWNAYRMFGVDLDSDGGRIVTVKDIANSPLLEVVQVFGVDPETIWP